MAASIDAAQSEFGTPIIAAWAGWLAMALVFACGLWSPPLLYLGLVVALLGLALDRGAICARLLKEPLAWVVIGLACWVGVRGWIGLQTAAARGLDPEPQAIWHHVRYSGLIPLMLAPWAALWWRNRWILFGFLCIGLIGYCISVWPEIVARMPVGRMHSGSYPEMGLIAGTGLVLSIGLLSAYAQLHVSRRSRYSRALLGIAVAAVALCFVAFVFSRVRSSWLSMLLALLVGLAFVTYRLLAESDARRRKRLIRNGALVVVVIVAVSVTFNGYFVGRLTAGEDLQTVAAIATGDFGSDNEGSFAKRYRMLQQGLSDIAANPAWGVGPASVRDMLEFAGDERVAGQGDYHNTYVNLASAMGLPWALMWLVLHVGVVGRAGYVLWAKDEEPALAFALVGAGLVHAIDLSFQVRVWNIDGSVMYILLMTVSFATLLRARFAQLPGEFDGFSFLPDGRGKESR